MTQADFPTDGHLVAFLDGELSPADRARVARHLAEDPQARERLMLLEAGGLALRDAFDALLVEAPQAMLSQLPGPPARSRPLRARGPWLQGAMAIAAAVVLFCSGIAVDRLWPGSHAGHEIGSSAASTEDWRQAVAEYLTLYSGETLASIPDSEDMRSRELATVATRVGVPLSLRQVSLPGLDFKRAQLLEYDGKPLGQLAYLDPQGGPTFLCIMADGQADAPRRTERREGFNVVFWSRGGRAFMLIGPGAATTLQSLAGALQDRIAG